MKYHNNEYIRNKINPFKEIFHGNKKLKKD